MYSESSSHPQHRVHIQRSADDEAAVSDELRSRLSIDHPQLWLALQACHEGL